MLFPAPIKTQEFQPVAIPLPTVQNFKGVILTILIHSLPGVLESTKVLVLPTNLLNHPVVGEVLQAVDQLTADKDVYEKDIYIYNCRFTY